MKLEDITKGSIIPASKLMELGITLNHRNNNGNCFGRDINGFNYILWEIDRKVYPYLYKEQQKKGLLYEIVAKYK